MFESRRSCPTAKNGESLLGVELVRQVHAHLLEDDVVEREQLAHVVHERELLEHALIRREIRHIRAPKVQLNTPGGRGHESPMRIA